MAGLFDGSSQSSSAYTTSTSEAPSWLQDAIYRQTQLAQGVAATPYTPYSGQLTAGLSPLQQQAINQAQSSTNSWQNALQPAIQGAQSLAAAGPGGLGAASPYLNRAGSINPLGEADPYFAQQSSMLYGINPNQAAQTAQQYANQASGLSGYNASQDYRGSALQSNGASAAMPWLSQAGQTSAGDIEQFMNPYTQSVTDRIAQLGARNLQENLLPAVSDSFVQAGQFGGSRMGEFGSRALRDTQDSILGQQSSALQAGYGQALNAAQADAARQAQIGQTIGGLTQQQQQALLQAGQQAGSFMNADQQNLINAGQLASGAQSTAAAQQAAIANALGNIGANRGNLAAGQQSALASIGSQFGGLAGSDFSGRMSGYGQLGNLAGLGQQYSQSDINQLSQLGGLQQLANQNALNARYGQYQQEQAYPQQQTSWLTSQLQGLAGLAPTQNLSGTTNTGNTGLSPLSQLGALLSGGAGLYNLAKQP